MTRDDNCFSEDYASSFCERDPRWLAGFPLHCVSGVFVTVRFSNINIFLYATKKDTDEECHLSGWVV